MTIAPLLLIDGMVGFRISNGVVILSLTIIRSDFNGESIQNVIQPALDLAMPLPTLRTIINTMNAELDAAEKKAAMVPHPTQQ